VERVAGYVVWERGRAGSFRAFAADVPLTDGRPTNTADLLGPFPTPLDAAVGLLRSLMLRADPTKEPQT
jgi:hypothetical protein